MKRKAQELDEFLALIDEAEEEQEPTKGGGDEVGLACPPWDPWAAQECWEPIPTLEDIKFDDQLELEIQGAQQQQNRSPGKPKMTRPSTLLAGQEQRQQQQNGSPGKPKMARPSSTPVKAAEAAEVAAPKRPRTPEIGEAKNPRKNASSKMTPELQELLAKARELLPKQVDCPRCGVMWDTRFYDFNNRKVDQPRYHCKACSLKWTYGKEPRPKKKAKALDA